jgi:hypothetical protein
MQLDICPIKSVHHNAVRMQSRSQMISSPTLFDKLLGIKIHINIFN